MALGKGGVSCHSAIYQSAQCKPAHIEHHAAGLDLFDIQDVGVRFYTYISSLQDLM